MGSKNLISFAVEQGWYDPKSDEPFDVNRIYGNGEGRSRLTRRFEQQLREWAPNVTLANMMHIVRKKHETRKVIPARL